ncbi:hypothetical protein MRB53_006850 [Persea americana]|uniref:Uncharacterized protein n=1 Tax=Persea americana TaxID=3435 RepID=A0ACC2MH54_PERAE|nr:hypothetical protein MRB53_006850 [Persea americana]
MAGDGKKGDEGGSGNDKKMPNSYTLTSNDNPGNIITQVQLKGENNDEWARAMRTALQAKKKYGFVDGTIKRPDDDSPDIEDWWTVNSMLVSWIFNTIEPTLRSTISYMENVKDLWEEIKQRFSVGNGPQVQQLRSDLANCKQDGQAIVAYYGRLKSFWDELNNYDTIPQERVRTMTRTKEERGNPMSFAIQVGRNSGGEGKDKSIMCTNCKRKGHDAETCFQRIGYPEWWGDRPRTATGGRSSGRGRGAQQNAGGGRGRGGLPEPTQHKCQDRTSRMLIGVGEQREGLYFLKGVATVRVYKTTGIASLELWHRRMGHPSSRIVDLISEVSNDSRSNSVKTKPCDICFRAKQTREMFFPSENKAKECFDLIHCDLWGGYRIPASCGAVYFLTIVDDCSRAVWIYLLNRNDDVACVLRDFITTISRQFEKNVKIVRSDNGTEFTCLKGYFAEHGILHQTSCTGTPQQNGRVERKHRHILNVARALCFQAHLPIEFWGECVLIAGYLINRTPSVLLDGKTPYEILYEQVPTYKHIRIFGCLCYVHDRNRDKDKFASRSRKCIFVGYPFGKKGWRLYDLERGDFFVSRDVVFIETEFPYTDTNVSDSSLPKNDVTDMYVDDEQQASHSGEDCMAHEVITEGGHDEETPSCENSEQGVRGGNKEGPMVSEEQLGKGKRVKQPSIQLKDYVMHTIQVSPSASSSAQSKSSDNREEQSDEGDRRGENWDTNSLIPALGSDVSIHCLIHCSRFEYGTLASLNWDFHNIIRSGELYRHRRKSGISEHWVYFSCNVLDWEAFDLDRSRWMHLPQMPSNECLMCSDKESLAVGTGLLVFGKEVTSHVVLRYIILTNSWSSGMTMNEPGCLFGSASLGEIAIVAGGCVQNTVLSSAEVYNSETSKDARKKGKMGKMGK